MDVSTQRALMEQFVKMVDRTDLRPGFPDQFRKNWENQGRMGTVRIFTVQLVDLPCELTFSLFFDQEEVIQTGIRIKYKNVEIVNAVQKGDALDYKNRQRIDPVAFLKQHYGTQRVAARRGGGDAESFTLTVDDDSEPQVYRAVEQLTGQTTEALKELWQKLINTNATRAGKDKISPIIKTWLKGQRDKLDMQFLTDAQLLQERLAEVNYFQAHGRTYVVACKRLAGHGIRAKIDSADPEWWGGTYYALRQGELVRMPHDEKDRLKMLRSFDTALEFPVEEIYIEGRHVYSVMFIADEALVWRTRDTINPDMPVYIPPDEPGKVGRLMSRFKRKSSEGAAEAESAPAVPPVPAGPKVHPFHLAKAENAYLEALQTRSPDLNDRRQEYMKLLYDSDRMRFARGAEELEMEMGGGVSQALKRDLGAMQREMALVRAHVTIFWEEQQAG